MLYVYVIIGLVATYHPRSSPSPWRRPAQRRAVPHRQRRRQSALRAAPLLQETPQAWLRGRLGRLRSMCQGNLVGGFPWDLWWFNGI